MNNVINLAYYRQEDWNRFLSVIDDRDSMHETWEEWHKSFKKTKNDLASQGFSVNKIIINLDELISYCVLMGMKNDGKARSKFVSNKSI